MEIWPPEIVKTPFETVVFDFPIELAEPPHMLKRRVKNLWPLGDGVAPLSKLMSFVSLNSESSTSR